MDPLSRKLFKPREAREKLRNMGGIMASSPELASTVQKFNAGGPIGASELQVPIVRSAIQQGGISFPSWEMMSRQQRKALGYPTRPIQGQFFFDRLTSDDADRFSPSGLRVPSVEELASAQDPQAALDEQVREIAEANRAEGRRGPIEALLDTTGRRQAEEDERRSEAGLDAAPTAEDIRAENRLQQGVVEPGGRPPNRGRGGPNPFKEIEPGGRPPRRDGPRREESDVDGDNAPPPPPLPDPDKPETFETTYEQMLSRLEGVMGKKDVDTRKKAMANLAMIGLAIASGQSPNALTNIAQGALSGMQAIRAEEASREEQERAVRMAAMKGALDLESSRATAEARAAEGELDRANRLEVARISAESRGGSGRNPRAVEDFVQNVYTESLKSAQDVATPQDMLEGETPEAYASRKSRIALREQQTMFPGTYGPNPDILSKIEEARNNNVDPAKLRSDFMLQFPGVDPSLYGL